MADTKISALTVASTVNAADMFALVQGGASKSVSASVLRASYLGAGLSNGSTVAVAGGYAADTYLAGSAITIPVAGAWAIGSLYSCMFDMTKTAAGVAGLVITVRMGTLGTTGDASIMTLTFGAGTAAIDTGLFEILINFRAVGSGTTAVLAAMAQCTHHLAATGLVSTGASGTGIIVGSSAGFNSTTQTVIGLSVNGGASFAGTNTLVQTLGYKI